MHRELDLTRMRTIKQEEDQELRLHARDKMTGHMVFMADRMDGGSNELQVLVRETEVALGLGLKVRESGMPDTEIMVVATCNDKSRVGVCKL